MILSQLEFNEKIWYNKQAGYDQESIEEQRLAEELTEEQGLIQETTEEQGVVQETLTLAVQ